MLEALPSTLLSDISLHQYGKLIESTHFLKNIYIEQQEIVWSLVKYLQKLRLNMGSTIYSRNEIADNLYIIHKGEVQLIFENEQSKFKETEYKLNLEEIKVNENFGENEMLTRCRRITSAVTTVDCQFYKLSQFNLEMIMFDYPTIKM